MKQCVITKRGMFVVLLATYMVWGGTAALAQFSLSVPAKTTAQPGETITVSLTLDNGTANAIDAFGLTVIFPGTLLKYDTVSTAETLTHDWLAVNGNQSSENEVKVGGFNLTPITSSGVLIDLKFTVKTGTAGKDSLKLTAFTDDLQGAIAGNGIVEISAAGTVFFAVLSGLQEVPPDTNDASGGAMFVLNAAQTELSFNIRVRGLSGPLTAAHFHRAAAGSNGSVVRTLTSNFTGEVASGVWSSTDSEPLTPALVATMLNGELYVNVHTAANPGGEIRGQVLLGQNMTFVATMNGSQENPAVNTSANGAAVMTLDSVGSSLSFNVAVNGLSGPITASHFHNEAAGANGNVVRAITNDFVGTEANGVWRDTDLQALTPALVAELLAGRIYVNVHTAANPGGEIRGQVFPADSVVYLAVLNGAQEPAGVTTASHGGGRFVLNAERNALAFHVKYANLGEPRTGAHFHRAAAGVNGPIVRPITEFVDTTAIGTWSSSDAQSLSLSLVAELLAGNIYVNIHTASNPGGQIRGQLHSDRSIQFGAQVNGRQEVPPVATDAAGYGTFTLNPSGTEMTYSVGVAGLSGTLNASHFHNNSAGKNGPVQRTITSSFSGAFASGVWKNTDAEPLTPALVVELLTNNIYVNAHTAANPAGEVRGQLYPDLKPVVPIVVARQITDGTPNVTIEGVVTTIDFNLGSASSSEYYLQDNTAGIRMFVTGKPGLARGALVRVHNGTIASNAQRKNIETARDSITVLDMPGVPAPQVVTAAEYLNNRANLEGELIRINNASMTAGTWPAANANQTVTINDGTSDLAMFLDRDTDIDGSPQPSNPMDIIGVATSFNNTPQIQPSSRAEILTSITFFAILNGGQENPPVNTPATGGGMFVLNSDSTELAYHVSVTGLSGPMQAAHFHNAPSGVNGSVVRAITFSGETASGVWHRTDATQPFTPALLAELLAGNIYVNVHTAANPGGEIRGQVLVGTPQQFSASLSGSQEVPPVSTSASGVGSFTLNAVGTELSYDVTVTGLSGPIQAAHFHNAATGVNGTVVRAIAFTDNSASGIWKASDTEPLTPALVAELLARKIYVNVHTAANPSGEIRGQLSTGVETIFLAVLGGTQENPPVTTEAVGGGHFVLNADRTALSFKIKVANLSGPITASHFHNAAPGTNGSIVRDISFTDTVATGTWSNTDANQPLTPALLAELLAGNLYVNVHTAANPGGEIRGQMQTGVAINFGATINGAQENPPVTTDAAGAGAFTLNANATELSYDVGYVNLSSPYTASHFHQAGRGKNGSVVRAIDFMGATTTSGIWKGTDAQALTTDLVVELLARQIYVNIHSSNFPGGEIRGQVLPGVQAITPIAIARQTANNTVVTVEGIITRARGRSAQLQDASAGIVAFQTSGAFRTAIDSGMVRMGDRLQVTGTLSEFNSLKEFSPISSFEVLSRDNPLPAVQLVTLAEIASNGEAYESELIRVEGLIINRGADTVFAAARTYMITDPSDQSNTVALRTPSASDTRIAGVSIPTGAAVFEGVLGQFSSTDPALGYQLSPILVTDVAPMPNAVSEPGTEVPAQFALRQNYPNPFNPTTNIRYDLPQNVRVKFVIYNLLGEKVRTLVDAEERAGAKQITWNGANDAGVKVASGIYVYRIEAGTFTATRKLMLMK